MDYAPGEAVNVSDPDGNGVELAYDRSAEAWPRVDGDLRVFVKKLERNDLLAELDRERAVIVLRPYAASDRRLRIAGTH